MGFSRQGLEGVAISFSGGIFLTQGLNLALLHCRKSELLYRLSYEGFLWGWV